jgi:hypothetical protein
MSRQTGSHITCFYDDTDVDETEDDALTGDEEEIAEMEARFEAIRQAKIKQIYKDLGVIK